jgi:8-oxo-dGTP pyrophosphatase MutT (NUDIX family)
VSSDELVAVYDDHGNEVGSATRGRVRAEGLWHACSSILVRSTDGRRVYVHRRTDSKDVYPGMYDCWAGGVMDAGENPAECAERELAEELGVRGVPIRPLHSARIDLPPVRYHANLFEVRTDGPFTHQPEEVASGGWMSLEELRAKVADPTWPMVPDGRELAADLFRRGLA